MNSNCDSWERSGARADGEGEDNIVKVTVLFRRTYVLENLVQKYCKDASFSRGVITKYRSSFYRCDHK